MSKEFISDGPKGPQKGPWKPSMSPHRTTKDALTTTEYEVHARLYKRPDWVQMILPFNVDHTDLEQVREEVSNHIRTNKGNILYEGANYRIVKITREVIEQGGPVDE